MDCAIFICIICYDIIVVDENVKFSYNNFEFSLFARSTTTRFTIQKWCTNNYIKKHKSATAATERD